MKQERDSATHTFRCRTFPRAKPSVEAAQITQHSLLSSGGLSVGRLLWWDGVAVANAITYDFFKNIFFFTRNSCFVGAFVRRLMGTLVHLSAVRFSALTRSRRSWRLDSLEYVECAWVASGWVILSLLGYAAWCTSFAIRHWLVVTGCGILASCDTTEAVATDDVLSMPVGTVLMLPSHVGQSV